MSAKRIPGAVRRPGQPGTSAATPERRTANPTRKALAVGETWFVKLPGATQCACVEVDELTERTVVLRLTDELGSTYHGRAGRYERRDVRFVERVPR